MEYIEFGKFYNGSWSEIRMGVPTSGALVITEQATGRIIRDLESCNPAYVWSNRSDAVAVPQWTDDLQQRLVVIFIPTGNTRVMSERYRVLELHSFDDGDLVTLVVAE